MNITIIFEFSEEVRTHSVVIINGKRLDLNRSRYDGNFRLTYELQNYNTRHIEFTLYSPTDFTTRNIQITLMINGRRFGYMVEKITQVPTMQRIALPESDEWERKYTKNNDSESHQPKHRKVKKGPNWPTHQETNKSEVSIEESDYSYFEKQKPREELLSKKSDEVKNAEVEVFYATNRKKKSQKKTGSPIPILGESFQSENAWLMFPEIARRENSLYQPGICLVPQPTKIVTLF